MGEGWVGVSVSTGTERVAESTPPLPLPIKGRGIQSIALHPRQPVGMVAGVAEQFV